MEIWILNHYATEMFDDKAGRHYWFAKELSKKGYNTTVFTASSYLNTNDNVSTEDMLYSARTDVYVKFVYVKTPSWSGNGLSRIKNWFAFYKNLFPVTKTISKEQGKPDVIIASSVHPLTMVAGIQIGRKLGVPCICEIRDLWPEAIFSFGKAKENSLLGKIMVCGEHWIYKNADALIFTKEGDTDYLKERRWTTAQGGDIDLAKCHYINNGLDNIDFQRKIITDRLADLDLEDPAAFLVIYAGTIRPVNNVGNLLDAAKIISGQQGYEDVRFLIYGDGSDLAVLKERVAKENIQNVVLKGQVEKRYIPYILSRSSINILNYSQKQYNWTRGNSSNKLFEYMASGKPIISTVQMGYSIIDKYKCGIELESDDAKHLADAVINIHDMNHAEILRMGDNGKKGALDFDFTVLTNKLLGVIEEVLDRKKEKFASW